MPRLVLSLLFLVLALPAQAQLAVHQVSDRTYALVGSLGNRDMLNLGNNATFGVILTDAGVVLIDSGGSYQGAARIDRAIQQITEQPVVVVINTGGQDHRWLGNSYWAARGARIIASAAAIADQAERASLQLSVLRQLIGDIGLAGTEPMHAPESFDDRLELTVGGVTMFLQASGGAHTPGDSFVWVPSESTVFTGDIVYVERMLGVLPFSNSANWLTAFEAIEALEPEHVVPGHGRPTDLLRAAADTYDYLNMLRTEVRAHMDAGGDIMSIGRIDQSAFAYLSNFEQLAGRNAQAVFEAMEWE